MLHGLRLKAFYWMILNLNPDSFDLTDVGLLDVAGQNSQGRDGSNLRFRGHRQI